MDWYFFSFFLYQLFFDNLWDFANKTCIFKRKNADFKQLIMPKHDSTAFIDIIYVIFLVTIWKITFFSFFFSNPRKTLSIFALIFYLLHHFHTSPSAIQPFNSKHDFQYFFVLPSALFFAVNISCYLSFASDQKNKRRKKFIPRTFSLFIFSYVILKLFRLYSTFACKIYSITMLTNYKSSPSFAVSSGWDFVDFRTKLSSKITKEEKIA